MQARGDSACGKYGNGQGCQTDERVGFAANLDLPNLAAATDVSRTRGSGDDARPRAAQMIDVQCLTDTAKPRGIDAQIGADAAQRLGERG